MLIEFRTGGRSIGIGSLKLQYDEESSTVIIDGDQEMTGAQFVEDMKHVLRHIETSRQRHHHDQVPRAGGGWVASHLDADGVLKIQRDGAWENPPLYYPEAERDTVRERSASARALIEKKE